jgi:hypothetical protein
MTDKLVPDAVVQQSKQTEIESVRLLHSKNKVFVFNLFFLKIKAGALPLNYVSENVF